MSQEQQKQKGCEVSGRSRKKCERYRNGLTRAANKRRKLKRHLSSHPGDAVAEVAMRAAISRPHKTGYNKK